ncbi:aminotransferase class I/II-fold pyridoxal phosphate-dependent enzyme [Luteococcus peritonei]|uniref:Aminotransferase class I/II-fold pyridoxal phosphate-dependent enzyme n=1 Tax=Luteococcus peritonei TaxID=88874 RepID=A0ABW4RYC3_9ACTN
MTRELTIFAEMSALATATGALNLGQGFPDDDGPLEILEAARRAVLEGRNQYPPGRGIPELRQAIAAHQRRFWGIELDPDSQVMVTAGATEALAASLMALAGPGDEVLTVEPFYDAYAAVIQLCGARHTTVRLRRIDGPDGPRFELDAEELAAAVTARTRVILLNNPNNPTGFQFRRDQLQAVVEAAERVGATIVTDEVYEHLCFEAPHVPVASLPGGFERTLTISSAGKTFSVTGWKVGWLSGPAELVDRVEGVKQWLTFTNAAPLQPAVAVGLGLPDEVFARTRESLRQRRDLLVDGLRAAGLQPFVPDAGYFTVADASALGISDAARACREMATRVGVVAIPYSAFCHPAPGEHQAWIRLAQCKSRSTLEAAVERLKGLSAGQ